MVVAETHAGRCWPMMALWTVGQILDQSGLRPQGYNDLCSLPFPAPLKCLLSQFCLSKHPTMTPTESSLSILILDPPIFVSDGMDTVGRIRMHGAGVPGSRDAFGSISPHSGVSHLGSVLSIAKMTYPHLCRVIHYRDMAPRIHTSRSDE